MLTDIFRGGGGGALGGLLGAVIPGVGVTTGMQLGSYLGSAYARPASMAAPAGGAMPAGFGLPALGTMLGGAAVAGRVVMVGARAIARSAITYCRRNPAWCAQIGGTAAIAAMIQDGRLPTVKRRRARGISASEFRGFRKVHRTLSGFCAPRMRIRRKGRS